MISNYEGKSFDYRYRAQTNRCCELWRRINALHWFSFIMMLGRRSSCFEFFNLIFVEIRSKEWSSHVYKGFNMIEILGGSKNIKDSSKFGAFSHLCLLLLMLLLLLAACSKDYYLLSSYNWQTFSLLIFWLGARQETVTSLTMVLHGHQQSTFPFF